MTEKTPHTPIIPYSLIVGQELVKMALELSYIAPRIGGVLISGQRGTGKSTVVRSFAQMLQGDQADTKYPFVVLPINATEDRVIGGWDIDALMRSESKPKDGLLKGANGGMLYVDEVNLLDDHIVNIILDVSSTGLLDVQREGRDEPPQNVQFTLVGTMNPEEGDLRPQLLDRFGLMVKLDSETNRNDRVKILQRVLQFETALSDGDSNQYIANGIEQDKNIKTRLLAAREFFPSVLISPEIAESIIDIAQISQAVGHRGERVIALASCALAALDSSQTVTPDHVKKVARLALQHRKSERREWTENDDKNVQEELTTLT